MESNQVRRGRQFWHEQYEQWQSSNLPKAAFCRQESLSIATFYYWIKKLSPPELKSGMHELPSAFVPLELTQNSTPTFSLQVADVTFSCNHPVSTHQLSQWLAVIRSTL